MDAYGDNIVFPMDYTPRSNLLARINRRRVSLNKVAPINAPAQSIITFGFDDFPKSAADTGAEIIESINAKAIFYACTGLAGKTNLTGEQYIDTDLLALDKAGHEIGAHTHTHLDCACTATSTAVRNITKNLDELKKMGLESPVDHFAYPYGETTVDLKIALQDKFVTARGIRPGTNTQGADRMQLASMELTPDTSTTARAIAAIEKANTVSCWLHIFTHDIQATPSPYGTTPQELRKIVRSARDSGIPVATPREALLNFGTRFDV